VLASFGSILESQWVGDWVMFLRFGKSFPRVLLIFLSRLLARFLLPILSSLSKLHHLAHLVCQFLLFLFLPWIGEANCKSFTLVWSEGLILQQRETRYQNIESRTPSNNGLPLLLWFTFPKDPPAQPKPDPKDPNDYSVQLPVRIPDQGDSHPIDPLCAGWNCPCLCRCQKKYKSRSARSKCEKRCKCWKYIIVVKT